MRLKDVSDIGDVDYAILEQNGKLSVFLKSHKQTVCLSDLHKSAKRTGICHAVIVDGDINQSNLEYSGKDINWLNKNLKASASPTVDKVFLALCEDNRLIVLKSEKTKE